MQKTANDKKSSVTNGKSNGMNKASNGDKKNLASNKKQGVLNVKVPTARERAKDYDEGRRHDAESNEL